MRCGDRHTLFMMHHACMLQRLADGVTDFALIPFPEIPSLGPASRRNRLVSLSIESIQLCPTISHLVEPR